MAYLGAVFSASFSALLYAVVHCSLIDGLEVEQSSAFLYRETVSSACSQPASINTALIAKATGATR
ncbi:hypothetical protein D3C75_1061110 [compost metagenome]